MRTQYVLLMASTVAALSVSAVPVALTGFTPYEQDFASLASSGTSSALPVGWEIAEAGANRNETYTAGTGNNNGGDTYGFGASGSNERALGGLRSGPLIPMFGVGFANETGSTLDALFVSYVGEQWRMGAGGRVDRLDFQYSLDATSLTDGTWTDFNALDFVAPVTSGNVGARDGNAAANRLALSDRIAGLSLAPGSTFWLRWTDFDATGSDDGLAIDDFSLQAHAQSVPESVPAGFVAAYLLALVIGASRLRPQAVA